MPKTMYEMAMVFSLDLSDGELDHMLSCIGGDESLVLRNIAEVTVKQTVPFVPTEEHLRKYADAMKGKSAGKFTIREARFTRYDYLRPVTLPDDDDGDGHGHDDGR